uniref:Uncharacterized protein n=1 Tax=Zea mays TaxID=4577 RepID=C4J5U1_MAIZE|nr:unknown [Zea mays]
MNSTRHAPPQSQSPHQLLLPLCSPPPPPPVYIAGLRCRAFTIIGLLALLRQVPSRTLQTG